MTLDLPILSLILLDDIQEEYVTTLLEYFDLMFSDIGQASLSKTLSPETPSPSACSVRAWVVLHHTAGIRSHVCTRAIIIELLIEVLINADQLLSNDKR